jgi:uncharacterized protein
MQRMKYIITLAVVLVAASVLFILPAAAQETPGDGYPQNTITVTGSGSAFGSPDVANVEIGVERFNQDVAVAFSQANEAIEAVIAALVAVGVEREDIRTTGLYIYQERGPMPMIDSADEQPPSRYTVSNQLRVTVRDIDLVADVINAAVEAGANNIYGLNFGIDDTTALETEARAEAIANANERAGQWAELIGAELGEVVVVSEALGAGFPNGAMLDRMATGLGGGAVVEPGQLSVSIQVQVTYRINR